MRYVMLFFLLLVRPVHAQTKVAGLGTYRLGVTTPDSLRSVGFREADQLYVKGTIALPCAHIRLFTADSVNSAGLPITHLSLFFYDNRLFKLECDYGDTLKDTFLALYGPGTPVPTSRFLVCDQEKGKPLRLWGESWQNQDVQALVMHTEGYNAQCKLQETVRLTIASQRFSALASDCDLNTDPLTEEFDKGLTNDPHLQKRSENHGQQP